MRGIRIKDKPWEYVPDPNRKPDVYPPVTGRTLEGLIAKVRKPATLAALEACRKPTKAKWLAAEKAGWNDVRLDTWDCLWLRQQATP